MLLDRDVSSGGRWQEKVAVGARNTNNIGRGSRWYSCWYLARDVQNNESIQRFISDNGCCRAHHPNINNQSIPNVRLTLSISPQFGGDFFSNLVRHGIVWRCI